MRRFALPRNNAPRKTTLAAVAALSLAFGLPLLSGCNPSAPQQTQAGTQAATGGNAAPPKAGTCKIAGISFQDDQFFKLIEMGMRAGAQKHSAELLLGSSAGTQDKESSLVDTYLARKVDAIVIAPLSAKASVHDLKRAHESGIKIVTFDSALDADFPVSAIKSDPALLGSSTGQEAAKYIQNRLGGKAKVAIITFLSLLPESAGQRTQGFEDAVKALPGVEIVAKQDAWLTPQAVNVVESILTAHPDVNLIWAANEGGTVGAVTAVKNAGKAGKVVVFGTDISEQIAGFLLSDDDILQAVTGQKPFDIGERAVETAVRAIKGEPVEKNVALPGALYTREKPEDIRKYQDYLRSLGR